MLGGNGENEQTGTHKLNFAQTNLQAINALITNFPQHAQKVIEECYLQPLNGQPKKRLKDGFIEREIHGGMHAGQVGHSIEIIHFFMEALFPEPIQQILKELKQALNLDPAQLLALIIFTGICHDCMRKGEGTDLWEDESSKKAKALLISLGINENLATLLSLAIKYKDTPQLFQRFLGLSGIEVKHFFAFDYIRKLIFLADCFDIMRCNGRFDLRYPLRAFKAIPGYSEQHKNDIITLTKAFYAVIKLQGNMLFDCIIIDEDGTELPLPFHSEYFRLKEKVKFEHADNVYIALYEFLRKNAFLSKYLKEKPYLKAKLYTGPLAFDPFIHTSNSAVLTLLQRRGWKTDHIYFNRLRTQEIDKDYFSRQKVPHLISPSNMNAEDKRLTQNPFPIMLVSVNEEKISISNFQYQQYRAKESLLIGEDIQIIATDTKKNANTLKTYLKAHQLDHVEVVLFRHLNEARKTKKKPVGNSVFDFLITMRKSLFARFNSPSKYPLLAGLTAAIFALLFSKVLVAAWIGLGLASALFMRNHVYRRQRMVFKEKTLTPQQAFAYQEGLEARASWTAYFKSAYSKTAWKAPLYFGAGLVHSNEKMKRNSK